jgi:hypothetical protein
LDGLPEPAQQTFLRFTLSELDKHLGSSLDLRAIVPEPGLARTALALARRAAQPVRKVPLDDERVATIGIAR